MFFFKKKNKREDIQADDLKNIVCDLFTVDMHSHILPGLDDGSPDMETSLQLARYLVSWGVKESYVTPHVISDIYPNSPEIIRQRVDQMQIELDKENIELKLYPAAEYRMDGDFLEILEKGKFQLINDRYLLVENSFYQEARGIKELLFKIQLLGYQPILAHPERYVYYQNDLKSYKIIKDTGCLFQINMLSLAGWYGSREKKTAEYLIAEGYVDFIGTDMHKIQQARMLTEYFEHSKHFAQIMSQIPGNKTISKL